MGVRRTGYPQELLAVAESLLRIEPQTEAIARRAISTAYYALFHLLIEEACELWSVPDHRMRIGRNFIHKEMRNASAQVGKTDVKQTDPTTAGLAVVASTFIELQRSRHDADYNLAREITKPDADLRLLLVREAFRTWKEISHRPVAQQYLLCLLFKERDS